jgi:hypothetical protein
VIVKVYCDIEEITLENENGRDIPSLQAVCSRCDQRTESFGTGERSRRRCLVLLREECPEGESNFYVDSSEEDSWAS